MSSVNTARMRISLPNLILLAYLCHDAPRIETRLDMRVDKPISKGRLPCCLRSRYPCLVYFSSTTTSFPQLQQYPSKISAHPLPHSPSELLPKYAISPSHARLSPHLRIFNLRSSISSALVPYPCHPTLNLQSTCQPPTSTPKPVRTFRS